MLMGAQSALCHGDRPVLTKQARGGVKCTGRTLKLCGCAQIVLGFARGKAATPIVQGFQQGRSLDRGGGVSNGTRENSRNQESEQSTATIVPQLTVIADIVVHSGTDVGRAS